MRGLRLKNVAKNKYGAKRIVIDNITFDSLREGARYGELKLLQRAREISILEVHPMFAIKFPVHRHGKLEEFFVCNVELDFSYRDRRDGQYHYEDVKGKDNPLSKLKRRLVELAYEIKVEIVK